MKIHSASKLSAFAIAIAINAVMIGAVAHLFDGKLSVQRMLVSARATPAAATGVQRTRPGSMQAFC